MNGAICGVYRKTLTDTFKLFKSMLQSFLPGFSSSLGAVPKSYAGKPTKAIYFHQPFQDVPAGADLAFFDRNCVDSWASSGIPSC